MMMQDACADVGHWLRAAGRRYLGEGCREEPRRLDPAQGNRIRAELLLVGDHRRRRCYPHHRLPRLLRCHSREPVHARHGNPVVLAFTPQIRSLHLMY